MRDQNTPHRTRSPPTWYIDRGANPKRAHLRWLAPLVSYVSSGGSPHCVAAAAPEDGAARVC